MATKAIHAAHDRMILYGKDWDGWGSLPPSTGQIRQSYELMEALEDARLSHTVTAITICPCGTPLWDFMDRRCSVACACPEPWAIVCPGLGLLIPEPRTTAGLVAMLERVLK